MAKLHGMGAWVAWMNGKWGEGDVRCFSLKTEDQNFRWSKCFLKMKKLQMACRQAGTKEFWARKG